MKNTTKYLTLNSHFFWYEKMSKNVTLKKPKKVWWPQQRPLTLAPSKLIFTFLSANPTKGSNTLQPTNCLSVFDHFVGLATKVLNLLIHTYDQDKAKKHNTKIKFQQICSFRLYRSMLCMTRKNTLLLLSSRLILSLSACLFMVKDIQRSNWFLPLNTAKTWF